MMICLGDHTFTSKQDARKFIRFILRCPEYWSEYIQLTKFGDCSKDSLHGFMLALLDRHPESITMIGVGVKYFYVAKSEHGTPCFWLKRINGTKTDFSYLSCLSGKAVNVNKQVSQAFRLAVKDQLRRSKERFFQKYGDSVECEVSEVTLYRDTCHMDHMYPLTFEVLVRTFLAARNIKYSPLLIEAPRDGGSHYILKNKDLASSFRRFHKAVAVLRIVSPEANSQCAEKLPKAKREVIL